MPPRNQATKVASSKSSTKPTSTGHVGILYGPEGVGKTFLMSHFPGARFIHDEQEHGILRLLSEKNRKRNPIPEPACDPVAVKDWMSLLAAIEESLHVDCQTVVIESLNGIQRLAFKYHCDKFFGGDMTKKGFFSYSDGPRACVQETLPHLKSLCDRLAKVGKLVVFTGHSVVREYKNPTGHDYDRYRINVNDYLYQDIKGWVSFIWFLNYAFTVEETAEAFNRTKGKAVHQGNEIHRSLYATYQPAFDAKSQFMRPEYAADNPEKLVEDLLDDL